MKVEKRMKKPKLREMILKLFEGIEEEDISISLFVIYYQDKKELAFFSERDQAKAIQLLNRIAEDSRRHKEMLKKIIGILEDSFK